MADETRNGADCETEACDFCSFYFYLLEQDRIWLKENGRKYISEFKYRVKLVHTPIDLECNTKGGVTYSPQELNFCPVCGRDLKSRRTEDPQNA